MKASKVLVIILIVLIVLIIIGLGIWLGVDLVVGNGGQQALSPYSAVYLSTGDIYFGKLDWSSSAPHMEDAWFLQRGTDSKGNPTVGVYPFSQVAWGPAGDVYFNPQQVVFWTRLSATSSIAQLIANPAAAEAQQGAGQQQLPAPTASSTPAASQ